MINKATTLTGTQPMSLAKTVNNPAQDDSSDDLINCNSSSLSLTTRLTGFASCTVAGVALCLLAFSVLSTSVRQFALLYGLANVFFISG